MAERGVLCKPLSDFKFPLTGKDAEILLHSFPAFPPNQGQAPEASDNQEGGKQQGNYNGRSGNSKAAFRILVQQLDRIGMVKFFTAH